MCRSRACHAVTHTGAAQSYALRPTTSYARWDDGILAGLRLYSFITSLNSWPCAIRAHRTPKHITSMRIDHTG